MNNFEDHVQNQFKYLFDLYQYQVTKIKATIVHFESDRVGINVVYDKHRSFEVNLFFGLINAEDGSVLTSYSIGELLRFKGVNIKENYRGFMASDEKNMIFAVKELSRLLKKYGEKILSGDNDEFNQLANYRHQEAKEYKLQKKIYLVRKDATTAWKNKDFKTVVSLYESIVNYLKDSELKRLNYAKKQING